jgi:hypothetical protein
VTFGCPKADDVCVHPGTTCLERSYILPRRKELFLAKGVETHARDHVPQFGRYLSDLEASERRGRQTPSSAWKCPDVYYDAEDGCDCNCGEWDPDCDKEDHFIVNCETAENLQKTMSHETRTSWKCDRSNSTCVQIS